MRLGWRYIQLLYMGREIGSFLTSINLSGFFWAFTQLHATQLLMLQQ
jgi:hypothetical protein